MDNFDEKGVSQECAIRKALEPFDIQQFALAGPPSVIIPNGYVLSVVLLIHE
jgi:hypothetical protein